MRHLLAHDLFNQINLAKIRQGQKMNTVNAINNENHYSEDKKSDLISFNGKRLLSSAPLSLIALSLAACGSSNSTSSETNSTSTTTTTSSTPVVAGATEPLSLIVNSGVLTFEGAGSTVTVTGNGSTKSFSSVGGTMGDGTAATSLSLTSITVPTGTVMTLDDLAVNGLEIDSTGELIITANDTTNSVFTLDTTAKVTVDAGLGNDVLTLPNAIATGTKIDLGGGTTDTLKLSGAAEYNLKLLDASEDALVTEAGIERLLVKHTSLAIDDTTISGQTIAINTIGAVNLNVKVAMAGTTLDLSNVTFSAVTDGTALGASDKFTITGTTGGDTITGSTLVDVIDGGAGDDIFVYASDADFVASNAVVDDITGGTGNGDTIRMTDAGGITIAVKDLDGRITGVEKFDLGTTAKDFTGSISISLDNDDVTSGLAAIDLSKDNSEDTSTVDLSAITDGDTDITTGGFTIIAGADNTTIKGTANSDTIYSGTNKDTITVGAGNDGLKFTVADVAALAADSDEITDFEVGTNTIEFTDLTNADLRGTGADYEVVTKGANAVAANTGIIEQTGDELNLLVATAVTAANTMTGWSAGDKAYFIMTTGTDTGIYLVSDSDGNGSIDTAAIVAILTGVDETNFAAANFVDFT